MPWTRLLLTPFEQKDIANANLVPQLRIFITLGRANVLRRVRVLFGFRS